jgi:uncharacterized protein (TIGR02118 family)
MLKVVIPMKKRPDLSFEQFKNYWLTNHKKLELDCLKRDPCRKIVVSFATGEVIGAKKPPYDALVELYFDNIKDMHAQFSGDRDRLMLEDEKNFIDPLDPRVFVVTEEYVIGEK